MTGPSHTWNVQCAHAKFWSKNFVVLRIPRGAVVPLHVFFLPPVARGTHEFSPPTQLLVLSGPSSLSPYTIATMLLQVSV